MKLNSTILLSYKFTYIVMASKIEFNLFIFYFLWIRNINYSNLVGLFFYKNFNIIMMYRLLIRFWLLLVNGQTKNIYKLNYNDKIIWPALNINNNFKNFKFEFHCIIFIRE